MVEDAVLTHCFYYYSSFLEELDDIVEVEDNLDSAAAAEYASWRIDRLFRALEAIVEALVFAFEFVAENSTVTNLI